MTQKELIQHILNIPAENPTIEFKRLGGPKVVGKIIDTVVAMTNTDGGTIVLGVDDPESAKAKGYDRVFGIEENMENFDEIRRGLQRIAPPLTSISPPAKLSVKEVGKTVALLLVPKTTDTFR